MNLRLENNPKHIFNRKLKSEMKRDQFLILFSNITQDDRLHLINKFKYSSLQIDIDNSSSVNKMELFQAFLVKEDFQRLKLEFTHYTLKQICAIYSKIQYPIRLDVRDFK